MAILLIFFCFQLKSSCKCKCFSHSEVFEQNVILHYIGTISLESVFIDRDLIVEKYGSRNHGIILQAELAICKYVQKTCLSSSRSSHNEGGLARSCKTWDTFKNCLSLHVSDGWIHFPLLLCCLNIDLKEDILPRKLDWLFAKRLGSFN